MFTDPSGKITLGEVGVSTNIRSSLATSSVSQGASIAARRAAGKAFEVAVEASVRRIVGNIPGAVVRTQRALTGPGGKRFFDILVRIKDRLIIIEAKTNIPTGGSALARLVGQIRTFSTAAEAEAAGAEVLIVSEGAFEAAALERIALKLGSESFAATFATEIELARLLPILLGL